MATATFIRQLEDQEKPCKHCREGRWKCVGCSSSFCKRHFLQHRESLSAELDDVLCEYDLLQQSMNVKEDSREESLKKIDEWETEMIQKIKETAGNARRKLCSLFSETTDKVKLDLPQLSKKLNISREEDNFAEQDIEKWSTELKLIDGQLKALCVINIDVMNIDEIDWKSMITVRERPSSLQTQSAKINFDIEAPTTIKQIGGDFSRIAASPTGFLHFQLNGQNDYTLTLINHEGNERMIEKDGHCVFDICWSSSLNCFIFTSNDSLYTVNETTLAIRDIRQLNHSNKSYFSITCHENTVLLSRARYGANIEEYDLKSWKLKHTYPTRKKERAWLVRFNSTGSSIGLLYFHRCNYSRRFELRSSNMILLKAIDCHCTHLIVPLPSNEWLIVHGNAHTFCILEENGSKTKIYEYVESINNAAIQFSENAIYENRRFVIVTGNTRQLHFFDLQARQLITN